MSTANSDRVAVVGAGLAGIAAAESLSRYGIEVHLFEARRAVGGRAGAYRDGRQTAWVDRCQHVAMGCCTNFLDLCERTATSGYFRQDRKLTFIDANNRQFPFEGSRWLPAPLHLASAFLRQGYLSWADKWSIAASLRKMASPRASDRWRETKMLDWLTDQRQSERAIRRFWEVVLVSALGAPLAEVSFVAARKVFVDGFLRHRDAYQIFVPTAPLQEILDVHAAEALRARGAQIHRGTAVKQIMREKESRSKDGKFQLLVGHDEVQKFDQVILAVAWTQVRKILSEEIWRDARSLHSLDQIQASPISSVHLWVDQPLTDLPHAVLLDRVSQWVFQHPPHIDAQRKYPYYQVVISASEQLIGTDHQQLATRVLEELCGAFGVKPCPRLLEFQVITEKQAVFAATPQLEAIRPPQRTDIPGLCVAGDWTQTGWPATMEGAVISGRLAAQRALASKGNSTSLVTPELPPALLSDLLWGLSRSKPSWFGA